MIWRLVLVIMNSVKVVMGGAGGLEIDVSILCFDFLPVVPNPRPCAVGRSEVIAFCVEDW